MASYVFLKKTANSAPKNFVSKGAESIFVEAKAGEVYELQDADTGLAPDNLKIKHVGNDAMFEVADQVIAVITDYYRADGEVINSALGQMVAMTGQIEVGTKAGTIAINTATMPVAKEGARWVVYDAGKHLGELIVDSHSVFLDSGGSSSASLGALSSVASGMVTTIEESIPSMDSAVLVTSMMTEYEKGTGDSGYTVENSNNGRSDKSNGSVTDQGADVYVVKNSLSTSDSMAGRTVPQQSLTNDSSNIQYITNNGTINVSGLVSGGKWEYSLDSGTTWTTGSGTEIPGTALGSDGAKYVLVRQVDMSGNVSANQSLNFILDTQALVVENRADTESMVMCIAPMAKALIDSLRDDVEPPRATLLDGRSTDDRRLVLNGSIIGPLLVGDRLAVYDGIKRLGYASTVGNTWTFRADFSSPFGLHKLSVRVENSSSGLSGERSAEFLLNEDGISISNAFDAVDLAAEYRVSGGTISEYKHTFTGQLATSLGSNECVAIYDGDNLLGHATIDSTGKVWSFKRSMATSAAIHNVTARVELVTGDTPIQVSNSGQLSEFVAVPPLQKVTITSVRNDLIKSIGGPSSVEWTAPQSLAIIGTLSAPLNAGDRIGIYDGAIRIGYATVVDTDWRFSTASPLLLSAHSFTAHVENVDSGLHGQNSAAFVMDEQRVSFDSNNENTNALQGSVQSGGVTDDLNPGSFVPFDAPLTVGPRLNIYNGNHKLGEAANGTSWAMDIPLTLTHGLRNLSVMVSDSVDNANVAAESFQNTCVDLDNDVGVAVVNNLRTLTSEGEGAQNLAMAGLNTVAVDQLVMGAGPKTLNLNLCQILEAGVDMFNTASGWQGLVSDGRHQMLVEGDSNDTVKIDDSTEAATWINSGQVSHDGNTYDVYNDSDGQAQILIDHRIQRSSGDAI